LEVLIDRERITKVDLEGRVFPAYGLVPPANNFWHDPNAAAAVEELDEQARLEAAVQILTEAGWSWKVAPAWDLAGRQVIPGQELRTPDGKVMSEISLIYPVAEQDLLMAAFGQEIADLLLSLGVPLVADELPREVIVNRTLIAGGSFDLYLLDWNLPRYPDYLCQLFASPNDTVLTGGLNTTGYDNPAFDALCTRFLAETDPMAAQQLSQQLQALLAEDRPYLSLFYPQVTDMTSQNLILPYLPPIGGLAGSGGLQTDLRVLDR
jgi:ABC-type transport system substrate-binding protein